MEKIKITSHQLFSLTATGSIGGSIIVASASVASIARQDAWITTVVTVLYGIGIIWIYCFLASRYPNNTLIGIIKKILGKWIGLIVEVAFVFFCLTTASRVLSYVGSFIRLQAMKETPENVITLMFMIAIVVAVLYGIEAISRASEIFIHFVSIFIFLAMLLVLPNARIENLQPVLERGAVPILSSSFFLSAYITFPLIVMMTIYPINTSNSMEMKKALFKGYLWSGVITFITILMTILVLGSAISAKVKSPTYLLAKEINVGVIFTRLEFIVAAVWIITAFMISVLFFYASVAGISELLGLRDNKKIVIPLGIIVLVMSSIAFPDAIYEASWNSLVWPQYAMTYGFFLPILLLFIFGVKKWILKWE